MNMPEKQNNDVMILHLYYDLMNLYGDWANADVLARKLKARGIKAEVERKSVGDDIDFGKYAFVYIGSGTERSQQACISDIARARHGDALVRHIEAGMHVLATGNAHEIFGRAVTTADGKRIDTLGLMEFETVQLNARVTGDSVLKPDFLKDRLIGFINRAGGYQKGAADRPFIAELGPDAGDKPRAEGIRYKNMLGTYLTGPILVRNPPLLDYFADLLYPNPGDIAEAADPFFTYQAKAYSTALTELSSSALDKSLKL